MKFNFFPTSTEMKKVGIDKMILSSNAHTYMPLIFSKEISLVNIYKKNNKRVDFLSYNYGIVHLTFFFIGKQYWKKINYHWININYNTTERHL